MTLLDKDFKRYKDSLVRVIEPNSDNFKLLTLNLRLNKVSNVISLRRAVVDTGHKKRVKLYLTPRPRDYTTLPRIRGLT